MSSSGKKRHNQNEHCRKCNAKQNKLKCRPFS
jgi:hypothetical protein